jgi:hypothetical protein
MPLANSNGPKWVRPQTVATEKRLRGIAPIRRFLAAIFGRGDAAGGSRKSAEATLRPPDN